MKAVSVCRLLAVVAAGVAGTAWSQAAPHAGEVNPYDEKTVAADGTLTQPPCVYTGTHAPPTPPLDDLPLKEQVSQYGMTWTFEKPARVGQFINGDWYVVGPVTIRDIDPRPLYGREIPADQLDRMDRERREEQRVRNGFMLNPPARMKVAYDSGVRNWFDPSLVQRLPVAMKPGDALVSTVSMPKGLVLHAQLGNRIERGVDDSSPIRTAVAVPEGAVDPVKAFDALMAGVVTNGAIPGAALAVTKDGRLVYARGFGWADVEERRPVRPDSMFRIASVSKPITAVAILQLVESGRLTLDTRVFDVLSVVPFLKPGAGMDPRLKEVTVLHLLQHAGGWDRDRNFDPMGIDGTLRVSEALGVPFPPSRADVIRYMAGLPLDFDPGTRSAYSNFGYLLLGRVIERVTGQTYEDYVRQHVLQPLGIRGMRIGLTHRKERAPGEVTYYSPGRTTRARFGPDQGRDVPLPYARCVEVMDSHGGWIASVVDLARFAAAFDRPSAGGILKEESVRRMFARPAGPWGLDAQGRPKRSYYACGWNVEQDDRGRPSISHGGAIEGTSASLCHRSDGVGWVFLLNAHDRAQAASLTSRLRSIADSVRVWPDRDLFARHE